MSLRVRDQPLPLSEFTRRSRPARPKRSEVNCGCIRSGSARSPARTKLQCGHHGCAGHGAGSSARGGEKGGRGDSRGAWGAGQLGPRAEPGGGRRGRGRGLRAAGAESRPHHRCSRCSPTPLQPGRRLRGGRAFFFFFFWLNFGHVNCPPFTFAPITRRGRIPRGATARRRRAAS